MDNWNPSDLFELEPVFLSQHWYLDEHDVIRYFSEYTPKKKDNSTPTWEYSATNSLIYNLKKSPTKKDSPDYKYKEQAIQKIAHAFYQVTQRKIEKIKKVTFVPIPPSKQKGSSEYDDRMTRVLYCMNEHYEKNHQVTLDIRELIIQKTADHHKARIPQSKQNALPR